MDEIRITGLTVFANHGVLPEETALGQKFLVSLVLRKPLRRAALNGELSGTVNYAEACAFTSQFLRENTFSLIESAAEALAAALLERYDIESAAVELKKPWAPIGLPLECVSVRIERSWHTAYIALGSNLGDREAHLRGAVGALAAAEGCRVGKVSSFIVTPPYGGVEQGDFLNGCLELRTRLEPGELLGLLHSIEAAAGRERLVRWGPRTLDLDIIFYDSLVLDSGELTIPHPDMANRRFVLAPLAEIAPYLRHPLTGRTVQEMLHTVEGSARGPSCAWMHSAAQGPRE